tara:strand:+ start:2737 stop:2976 length:240 start_codon:yes stop_codon:yes gene_type:complete
VLNNFIFNLFLHSGFLVNFTHIDSIIELEFKSQLFIYLFIYLHCLELSSGCGLAAREEKWLFKKIIYTVTTQEINHHDK